MNLIKKDFTEEVEPDTGLRISSIWIYRQEGGKALQARKDHEKGHARLCGEWMGILRALRKKQRAREEAGDRSGHHQTE